MQEGKLPCRASVRGNIFLFVSLTIIILSQNLQSMKHKSHISIERITVDNPRWKEKWSNIFMTHFYVWNLHAWRKPKKYYKGTNPFHFCSFPCARASEMNNAHYLFNNSYARSVPVLFPSVLVLLTWICRAGKNCCILRTAAKEQGRGRGRKRKTGFVYFLFKLPVTCWRILKQFQYEK